MEWLARLMGARRIAPGAFTEVCIGLPPRVLDLNESRKITSSLHHFRCRIPLVSLTHPVKVVVRRRSGREDGRVDSTRESNFFRSPLHGRQLCVEITFPDAPM